MSIQDKIDTLREKFKAKAVEAAMAASVVAPMAPISAEAAKPASPEQPKTEQYAPNQTPDNNNDGKTFRINGVNFTPVDEVPNSNQPTTRSPSNSGRQTDTRQNSPRDQRHSSATRDRIYADDEEPWIRDPILSRGLDKSIYGYRGAYYQLSDPDDIHYFPIDPRYGQEKTNHRVNALDCHDKHMGLYDPNTHHNNRNRHRIIPNRGAERVAEAVSGVITVIDAVTRGGR